MVVVLGLTLAVSPSDATPNYDPLNAPVPMASELVAFPDDYLAPMQRLAPLPPEAPPPRVVVPRAAPVQILIPLLDVHRAVDKVGTDRYGRMELPGNSWNAGWYKGSPVPGAPGDAVIEGHAGYPGKPMLFGRLVTLRPGDKIVVVLADHTRRLFIVVSTSSLPVGTTPAHMAEPYGPPRLTLITCTGHFDKDRYSYSSRLVVEARYAGVV